MGTFNFRQAGLSENVKFGKSGARIKAIIGASPALEVRNNADDAYQNLRASRF